MEVIHQYDDSNLETDRNIQGKLLCVEDMDNKGDRDLNKETSTKEQSDNTAAATKRETATWIVINISKKESLDLI